MKDDAIIKALQQELSEVDERAKRLRGAIASLKGERTEVATLSLSSLPAPDESGTAMRIFGDLSGKSQVDAIVDVLSIAGGDLSKTEIVDAAAKRGKIINPTSLPSQLSRNKDKFESAGGGRWRLKAEALI